MAKKAKKKRSYRESCRVDLSNGNNSKFSKACAKKFPHLVTK